MKRHRARIDDFTIGWICALPIELTAAREALDDEYERIDDVAHYTLGRIGKYNVAVGCLPGGQMGTSSAATIAACMKNTFHAVRYWFLVGIAGGVPSKSADVRLGDVVISHPQGRYGGVVQYDFGKTVSGGQSLPNGHLNAPHSDLLQAVSAMRSAITAGRSTVQSFILSLTQNPPLTRPSCDTDELFDPAYDHIMSETCESCLKENTVLRAPRINQDSVLHYGIVASGNQVVRDGMTRDRISTEYGGVLCFEMEAADLMNILPCLVIRCICDYADSHKNNNWQPFAAATAAACAKEVLTFVPTPSSNINCILGGQLAPYGASPTNTTGLEMNGVGSPSSVQIPTGNDVAGPSSTYTRSLTSKEELRRYHRSLKFSEIDARHATIQDAHPDTCSWLLARPEYHDWIASDKFPDHHGFFWIRGNPGTGKSTIMKWTLDATQYNMTGSIVINFFFNARGDTLEKTVLGMYRSLLFQLLDRLPGLQCILALRPPKSTEDGTSYVWTVEALQTLFGHAVKRLGHRSLICFIDALDECEEEQIRSMITFFEHIGDLAVSSNLGFRTFLASRHYPHIALTRGIALVLEDEGGHMDDITKYVNSKLHGPGNKLFDSIKRDICARSSGIFLWVVLVVHLLKKDVDSGQIHACNKRLERIPDKLDELFDDILTRDTYNMDRLFLCLQWIFFAIRPLTSIELFYAVLISEETGSLVQLDPRDVDEESLENFVLASSKGLAELTKGDSKTVQFIHESVREYLLESQCLQRLRASDKDNLPGSSHQKMRNHCLDYITTIRPSLAEALKTTSESTEGLLTDLAKPFTERCPFLQYAVHNVLLHADAAAGYGLSQDRFVKEFPFNSWLCLSEMTAMDRPYGSLVNPLYIFAVEDAANLIKAEVKRISSLDVQGSYHGNPLNAAVSNGTRRGLRALLTTEHGEISTICAAENEVSSISTNDRAAAIAAWFDSESYEEILRDQTLLCWAAEHDLVDLMKVLLSTRKVDINLQDYNGQTALSVAARSGQTAAAKILLEVEKVRVNDQDFRGWTPLSWAALMGHTDVIKALLRTGKVDIDYRSKSGRTALSLAAGQGHSVTVNLMLDLGKADIESKDLHGWTPICWAASYGHLDIVKSLIHAWKGTLISHGRDLDMKRLGLNEKDSLCETPLHDAVALNAVEVVKFLVSLDEVDFEATNGKGRTPLELARVKNHLGIMELLQEVHRVREANATRSF
jgi:ankyrin repeat protein/nucleoside phosphorylase